MEAAQPPPSRTPPPRQQTPRQYTVFAPAKAKAAKKAAGSKPSVDKNALSACSSSTLRPSSVPPSSDGKGSWQVVKSKKKSRSPPASPPETPRKSPRASTATSECGDSEMSDGNGEQERASHGAVRSTSIESWPALQNAVQSEPKKELTTLPGSCQPGMMCVRRKVGPPPRWER